MKRVVRSSEPPALATYRNAVPNSTWDQMKDDAHNGGPTAYKDCRTRLIGGQGGLCAYCEIDIRDNNPLRCRVEHFHPKSDTSGSNNWALDWDNMLGVCSGGSCSYALSPHALEPIADNLSCDAYKDKMINTGKLQEDCEGWILNPTQLVASPSLFLLEKSTGRLCPDEFACSQVLEFPNNKHQDIVMLVQHTIDMLNLNCDRLCQARLVVIRDIERNKKRERDARFSAPQGLANLASRYFRQRWPGFFTTIRLCLGSATETYLQSIQFQG